MNRLASLLALALAAAPLSGARGAAPAPPSAATRVRAVRPGAPAGAALVPASVVAARRATISTRVAAGVREVHVREGQRVAAGQLLVSLADSDVRGGVAAAESGLAAARTHERRIQALSAERAATPSELEMAVAQRAQAEAALAAARATLAYTELRAPFAATVQARRIDPGDLVGPGQPLLELEGEALELVATLSEAEAQGLSIGAAVRFEAGAVRGGAVVNALTPGGDALSHRRTVRARVQSIDGGGTLRTGTFARLHVPAGAAARGEGRWIPRSALVERGDLSGVFVASAGRAELRWLSLGEDAGALVLVRAGLRAEDVVVDAPGALREGQAVEVLP
jgi:membrane fusion protein, multidrug efflux system